MSSLANVIELPVRRELEERDSLEQDVVLELVRRNEALEDFAALVAHELKTPLLAALVADDPSGLVDEALDLVETLLEAATNDPVERTFTAVPEILDRAVEDLRLKIEITSDVATTLPLPPESLRVILRNLLSNAVSAGARHVHVTAVRSMHSWLLLVDDDGVGLAEGDLYAAGSSARSAA